MLLNSKKISIVIPAYNEEKIIYNTLKEVKKTLDGFIDYEIIVIDDNSTDNTFNEAMKAARFCDLKVIKNKNGKGKGSALKTGVESASYNLISFIDADLDLHPSQLKLFIEYMKKYNADVVVGSKRHPLSKLDYPIKRKILSYFYNIFIRLIFGLKIKDTQAGLKLFKTHVLREVLPKVLAKKYAFDLELLVNIHHRGYKIVEAPIELNFQRLTSRIKLKDVWNIFVDTCAIFYRLRILKYYNGVK